MRVIAWHLTNKRPHPAGKPVALLVGCGLAALVLTSWPEIWPAISVGLDAGHGGIDPGAIGANGLVEKDVTLSVARMTAEELHAAGEEALLIRNSDSRLGRSQRSDLQARVHVAHKAAVDVYVSIHCNGYRLRSVHGPRTYYQSGSAAGRQLAAHIQTALRTLVGYGQQEPTAADYLVTRASKMPAVIVELGYITNPGDERLLRDPAFRRKMARAIADGIRRYAAVQNI